MKTVYIKNRASLGFKIRYAVGSNCGTRHAVPSDLTDRRLMALMDAVFIHRVGRASDIGWLALNGYVEIRHGSVYATAWALPLVCAIKRQGYYYWAGSDAPNLITDDGRALDGYYAHEYCKAVTND